MIRRTVSVNPTMPQDLRAPDRSVMRVILAGGVGSAVEWFDFGVYGYLAPVLGARFFPAADPVAAALSGFAVFCVGYLMRPVGGLLLGRLGDRFGRRRMLMLSVLAMGAASVLIGVLPTYDDVGVLAPVLLVLLRSIQGIAVGGEYTGAMAYTSECAPPRHRGLVSSMATVGVTIGLLGGSGAVALLQWTLPPEAVAEWGWRLPFLGSILVAAIGLALRAGMPESSSFRAGSSPPPMAWQVLRSNAGRMLRVIAVIVGANAAFYAGFVYMPDTLAQAKPELAGRAQTVNSAMLAAQVVIVAAGGWISDRMGRRSASILFTVLAIAAVVPAWRLFQRETLEGLIAAQALLTLPLGALFGMQGAMVAEMCPPTTRCTVYGISYGVGIAAFAGTVPAVATWMVGRMGWIDGPLVYMLLALLVALATLCLMRPSHLAAMDDERA